MSCSPWGRRCALGGLLLKWGCCLASALIWVVTGLDMTEIVNVSYILGFIRLF